MYINTAADRSVFAKELKRIHKERLLGIELGTIVFYNQGSCAIFIAGYGPFWVYSTCDGGNTLIKAGTAEGRFGAYTIWDGALRQLPEEAWAETNPDVEDATYFRRMELHLLPPKDPYEGMLTQAEWAKQTGKSLEGTDKSERISYKGFEFEKVEGVQLGYRLKNPNTPGKGRKFKGYYIYSSEDNFERPFKTVDSLAEAKAYIDNY